MSFIKSIFGTATGFFGGGIGGYIGVALAVLLAAAVGGVIWQESRISDRDTALGSVEQKRQDAVKLANDNATLLVQEQARHERALSIVGSSIDAALKRDTRVNTIIREVTRAHPEDVQPTGCPAVPAPILRALDGVRSLHSGPGDQGGGDPRPGAKPAVELRPRS